MNLPPESWPEYLERLERQSQEALLAEAQRQCQIEQAHPKIAAHVTRPAGGLERALYDSMRSNVSGYPYKTLEHALSFRLLEIFPRRHSHQLITALVDAELGDTAPDYEALSYTWGTATKSCRIVCNGELMLTTPNCLHALERLRLPLESRLIWVDSICIDQSSLTELSHQVALMGHIYKQATQVIIWLGKGTRESHLAYQMLYKAKFHMALDDDSDEEAAVTERTDEETDKILHKGAKMAGANQFSVDDQHVLGKSGVKPRKTSKVRSETENEASVSREGNESKADKEDIELSARIASTMSTSSDTSDVTVREAHLNSMECAGTDQTAEILQSGSDGEPMSEQAEGKDHTTHEETESVSTAKCEDATLSSQDSDSDCEVPDANSNEADPEPKFEEDLEEMWGMLGMAVEQGTSTELVNTVSTKRENGLLCLQKLLERQWFERMWTVQELALARYCTVICGSDSISWTDFLRALIPASFLSPYGPQVIDKPIMGHLFAQHLVKNLPSDLLAQLSEDGLPDSDGDKDHKILQLLQANRNKQCADPRDKVYALFGLLQAIAIDVPAPDYTKTIEEVYIEAADVCLQLCDSPAILLCISPDSESKKSVSDINLPSWVPDWSIRSFGEHLHYDRMDTYQAADWMSDPLNATFKFSLPTMPSFQAVPRDCVGQTQLSTDGRSLSLSGIRVDEIRTATGQKSLEQSLHAALMIKHFPHVSPTVASYIDEDWTFLTTTAARCLVVQDSTTPTAEHPIIEMLMLNDKKLQAMGAADVSAAFDHWIRLLRSPDLAHISSWFRSFNNNTIYSMEVDDPAPFALSREFEGQAPLVFINRILDNLDLGALHTNPDLEALYHTLLAENLAIGLTLLDDPIARGIHDSIVQLFSNHYIYQTQSGRLGRSCSPVQSGDVVVLIEGLHLPAIIRPTQTAIAEANDTNQPTYRFVGTTYLVGAMNGELWSSEATEMITLV